jgi:putative SOS response-associated peptidase YedK
MSLIQSAIIAPCAGALDLRGESRSSKNTSMPSRGKKTGARVTTLPQPSPVAVIRQNPKEPVRELSMMRWGLIPSWAKDASGAARMIKPRAGTASTKPAFRDAMKSHRCLIPADAFLRLDANGKTKQPYYFEIKNGELFAFAGLWDRWKDTGGNTVETCSILTTTANAVTSAIHDRMPVILSSDDYDLWLDPGMTNVAAASELLKPCDARQMRCFPVSTRINSVANDGEGCSAPVELAEVQNRRFHSRSRAAGSWTQ